MKRMFVWLFILLFSYSCAYAARTRGYTQRVIYPNSVLGNLQFPDVTSSSSSTAPGYIVSAWIVTRPSEVISTTTHTASYIRLYRFGNGTTVPYDTRVFVQFSQFVTDWSAGEILHVQIINNNVSPARQGYWELSIPDNSTAALTITNPSQSFYLWPGIENWTYNLQVNGPAGIEVTGPGIFAGTMPHLFTTGQLDSDSNNLLGNWTASPAPTGYHWVSNPIVVQASDFSGAKIAHVFNATIEFLLSQELNYITNPCPPDAANITQLSGSGVTLSWDPVPLAIGYKLFWNGASQFIDLSTPYWTTPSLETGAYSWQVVPYDATNDALDCPVWHFAVENYTLNPTTNPSPVNASISTWEADTSVTLSWDPPEGGDSPDGYRLFFDDLDPIDMGTIRTWSSPLLGRGTYTWQVIPYKGTLDAQNCPVWSFSIAAPLLVADYNRVFGQVWENHSVERTFSFLNSGNSVMDISLLFNPSIFTINPAAGMYHVLPSQTLYVVVSFRPTAQQSYNRNLYIETNDPEHPYLTINLTGSGYSLTAGFNTSQLSGYIPLQVEFNAITQAAHQSWRWDFGDGTTAEGSSVIHEYTTGGLWQATLTVTDNWGFTLSSSQTIDAINWAAINAGSEEVLFADTYLGSSDTFILNLQNSGPGTLHISSLALKNNCPAYNISNGATLHTIAPYSSVELILGFEPILNGIVADSLVIISDAINTPRLALKIQGAGFYVPPMPPANVQISSDYPDVLISWNAVTHSILDSPVNVPYYFIYGSKSPNAPETEQFFLGYSVGTTFRHLGVGLPGSNIQAPRQYFYYVCAVLYYPSLNIESYLDNVAGEISRKELQKALTERL